MKCWLCGFPMDVFEEWAKPHLARHEGQREGVEAKENWLAHLYWQRIYHERLESMRDRAAKEVMPCWCEADDDDHNSECPGDTATRIRALPLEPPE